jgi:hypothetical protein
MCILDQGLGDGMAHLGSLFGAGARVMAHSCPLKIRCFAYWTTRTDRCLRCKEICPRGPAWADMNGASLDTVLG